MKLLFNSINTVSRSLGSQTMSTLWERACSRIRVGRQAMY
ncbi:hypothetical protein PDR5_27520 [Pseudomonas sp. DR 5-09]|nr:hypothetical protein PDR5_27520 [Pseudomonas sp. DR 5-09]